MSMTRYRIGISIQLNEHTIGTVHHHKITGRVLDFGDSKIDATREFNRLESAILVLLEKAEKKE